jgi:hypothetical protein
MVQGYVSLPGGENRFRLVYMPPAAPEIPAVLGEYETCSPTPTIRQVAAVVDKLSDGDEIWLQTMGPIELLGVSLQLCPTLRLTDLNSSALPIAAITGEVKLQARPQPHTQTCPRCGGAGRFTLLTSTEDPCRECGGAGTIGT